ncbi:hypothetical protein DFH29DRAFT_1025363 [Suillus ampliporus]|nr:hypothetical protein DFH29DRAFT_1025363 [Suillus ampliporus]
MISAFNGAARATITGYLIVSYFKEAVIDPTYQLICEAKKVSALGVVPSNFCVSAAILVLASNKAAREFLSDDVKQTPAPTHASAESHPSFTGDNMANTPTSLASPPSNTIATVDFDDLPVTCYTPRKLLPTSPIQNSKRFSIDSDATFVDDALDCDIKDSEQFSDESSVREADFSLPLPGTKAPILDDLDGASGSQQSQLILLDQHQTPSANPDITLPNPARPVDALAQTTARTLGRTPIPPAIPRLKPPDTKHTAKRPPHYTPTTTLRHQLRSHLGNQKYEPRVSRLNAARDSIARSNIREHTTMIAHLEEVYDDILYDQAALVDGWAAAMAALGLPSMLSPGPSESLPNQKNLG